MNRTEPSITATLGGFAAVLIWSTTVAVARTASEQLGAVTAAAMLLGGGGLLGLLVQGLRYRGFAFMASFPRKYLVICGALFVFYEAALYLAIGLAGGRGEVLGIALLNYLWIPLTQVLAIPVLHKRASGWFVPGVLLASGGAALALFSGAEHGISEWTGQALTLYVLALACGISWALYSVLSRRLGGTGTGSAVPLFLAVSGLVLAPAALLAGETARWSTRAVLELLYLAAVPSVAGYALWDTAMRRGRMEAVTAAAYFIPVASTVISSIYLGVPMGAGLWLACGLVTAGAFITRASVRDGV